ncbi:MAG: lysozyme M1 (1,4-beta-N-acetylmuramidase) [Actinomycetota bacterium]|nr:lysozyme M1 (1,4-beta-N-acetylmuramidase) [Actinomycetota bacterium]
MDRVRNGSSRKALIVVVAVAALVSLGVAWWFLWVPNWRPPLEAGERYGVDVSAHQGVIDWDAVAADEIEFAYIKATEGGDFIDDRFADNWAEAERVGLDRGAYHFFTLCTPGVAQADIFLEVAPPDDAALAPAVDLELAGNCSKRPPRDAVLDELLAFIETVERAWDKEVILYLGDDFEGEYEVRERLDRPLWLRRFLLEPTVDDWYIWQLHGYAHIEGIEGGADLDVMRPQFRKAGG